MDFTSIGIAHSPFRKAGTPPFQSTFSLAEGTIEIFPEYWKGLLDIEGFSHLILIYHFDRAERRALTELPLSDGETPHGIFATRHYNRPNPIGISYVGLTGIHEGTLQVTGLDLLEGTPILDIKPYVPAFDSIPHAVTGWVSAHHLEKIRETSLRARQDILKNGKHP
jgi:tRNA-Thr(GGU) m(6)t(6)A37 methyltransferase TsaA